MPGEGQSVSGEVVDRAPPTPAEAHPRARFGLVGILLLCLVAFLPGFFGMPPSNREGRFAQASRQVFESLSLPGVQRDPARHSAIVPRVQDRLNIAEGPAGHWVQAAAAAFFSRNNPYRDTIWMYRVPSLASVVIVLVLTRRLAAAMFDASAGRLAALLFAVCPLALWQARQADPTMMGAAWTVAGMSALWAAWPGRGTAGGVSARNSLVFWTAVAAGTLTAGLAVFITLVLALVAAGAFTRQSTIIRAVHTPIGFPGAIGVIALWLFLASGDTSPGVILQQMWRGLAWNQGWMLPGAHTVVAPALLWPGSLLIIPGILVAWKLRDKNPGYLFLICWVLPAWLILEAMPGKSLVATLPLYPALAILGARAVLAADAKAMPGASSSPTQPGNILWLIVGAAMSAVAIGLLAGRIILWPGSALPTAIMVFVTIAAAFILLRALRSSWRAVLKGSFSRAAIAAAGVPLVLAITLPTYALPRWLGLSRALNEQLDHIDPSGARPLATAGFWSDSLMFLTRGRLHHEDSRTAQLWLARSQGGILLRDGTFALEGDRRRIAAVSGLDPSRWDAVEILFEELPP